MIDVHHHILPPSAPDHLRRLIGAWTAERAVAQMDLAGVATAIAYPGPLLTGGDDDNRRLAREWNDFGAKVGDDHPGRFGLFASLPLADVEGALAEIDFALDHLHADGFGIATSYGEAWLGDERFWPIWDKLNDRGAVVFVHPADAACCAPAKMSYIRPGMDGSWIEWPMNTARTILSLMASGTLRRFARIRFIFCHGGGVMPLLVERLAGFTAWDHVGEAGLQKVFPLGVRAEFQRLYFECAQAYSKPNMGALRALVPDSQILFGSDYPFFPITHGSSGFAGLDLPKAAVQAIGRGNAQRLLPRWA